jgi:hypothetical protein
MTALDYRRLDYHSRTVRIVNIMLGGVDVQVCKKDFVRRVRILCQLMVLVLR